MYVGLTFVYNIISTIPFQADLVTLLRTGLDDNNSLVIMEATVSCLAELVDNQARQFFVVLACY